MSDVEPNERLRLAGLQLEIMDVLWRLGRSTVGTVRDRLADAGRDLAYTTVATMLTKMEKKGVVSHHAEGRVFFYETTVARTEVADAMTGALIDGVFGGSPAALVSHLLSAGSIEASELDAIREAIRRKEAGRGPRP